MPDQTDAVASPAAEGGAPNPESTQTTTAPAPSRESRIQTMVREMATRGVPPKPPEASPPAESPAAEPEGAPVLSETPPAAAETPQPGTEKPPEPAAEHESETVPQDIRKAVSRIRQLKDQRKALKAELGDKDAAVAALTAQVEALQAQVDRAQQPKTAAPTFEGVEDPQVIESEVSQASKVVEWAEDRLDSFDGETDTEVLGAELESQGVKAPPSGWTPKAVRQTLVTIRNNARTTAKAGSERKQWLSIESQALEYVAKSVPQLQSDPALANEVSALLEARPSLRSMPEWPVASVALALGMRALRAGPPKPAVPTPPAVPVPPATPPRPPAVAGAPRATVPVPVDVVEDLRRKATAPGASREDRVALLKAQLLKTKG